MSPDKRRMRPMGIADILDETVELYKTSFVLLVGIAAVMNVPYAIMERYFLVPRMMSLTTAASTRNGPSPADLIVLLGAMLIAYGYLLVTAPIVTGALTYAISERYLDRKVTIIGSFRRVFSASIFGQLLLAIIIKALVLVAPMLLVVAALFLVGVTASSLGSAGLVIIILIALPLALATGCAAIYVLLRLALVETTIVVEGRGIGHALSRTWTLMRANMLKCLGLYAIAWIVTAVVSIICTNPTQTIIMTSAMRGGHISQPMLILHTAIGAISSTVLAPVISMVTILLYYDIRIRREGFDLELLASELDEKSRRADVWTAPPLPQEIIPQPAPEGETGSQ